jgi:carboxypeptidase C (cathepsin A)
MFQFVILLLAALPLKGVETRSVLGPYEAEFATFHLPMKEGHPQGEVGYFAYTKSNLPSRPITFIFNGGPGSSSIWLHFGGIGPKKLVSYTEGGALTPPYRWIDNEQSPLAYTDLVFIDPLTTGLSLPASDDAAAPYLESEEDARSISWLIRDYLIQHRRTNVPIYVMGESYGSCRAALVVDLLQSEEGIYPKGMILISPALDFELLDVCSANPLYRFLYLPTYVATSWKYGLYRPNEPLEVVLRDAIEFSYAQYAPFLLRPTKTQLDVLRTPLSTMTYLPVDLIEEYRGTISPHLFVDHFLKRESKIIGWYDSSCQGPRMPLESFHSLAQDPSVAMISGPFTSAFYEYLAETFDIQKPYRILSEKTSRLWDYKKQSPGPYPTFVAPLQRALCTNADLKVWIGSGIFDLVTPFMAAAHTFQHFPAHLVDRTELHRYQGGHMFYLSPDAQDDFFQDLASFYALEKSAASSTTPLLVLSESTADDPTDSGVPRQSNEL